MSRIIITNIPKNTNQNQLKQHFLNLGQITDCKIIKNQYGQSRKFAFIGFKNSNSDVLAQKYYNKTYMGTSKIKVEKAKIKDEQVNKFSKILSEEKNKKKKQCNLLKTQQKFNQFKKIVQESSKKTWDDLITPSILINNMKTNNEIEKHEKKSKKQIMLQKKQRKCQQKLKQTKKVPEMKLMKTPNISEKNKKYVSQPLNVDQCRLFITNIPYHITEQEIRNQFNKFGVIKKIKVPMEYDGSAKGYAFVTYQLPQQALRAFSQIENKVFFGRILHVKPAMQDIGQIIKSGKQADFEQRRQELYGQNMEQKTSYKKQKKKQMRERLNDTTSWNTLFLNPNTILNHISEKLGIKKQQIFKSDSLASNVSLMEAQIIEETKNWMISQGLNIQFLQLDRNLCSRSDHILLVKNLNYHVKQNQILQLFGFYGIVQNVLLAPNKTIAIVSYRNKQFAKNAFEKLQNTKYKNNFLYLEYAPINMLSSSDITIEIQKAQQEIKQTNELSKIVYIKNLNFQTNQSQLHSLLSKISTPKYTKIIKDKSNKSMGYAFAQFSSNQQANKIIKKLQNQLLDGHKLTLSISKKIAEINQFQKIKQLKEKIGKEQTVFNKLIVRNLAFQATKKDVRELFQHFGSIKNVRLPKKMNGQHRGFGFVEYSSAQEAALAKQALSSSHLYGRKLVIQYEKGSQLQQTNL